MLGKARVIGVALATLTSPLALAQGSFTNGQTLWDNSCVGCHDLQSRRDQITQRPPIGLTYPKSLDALTAALTGTDLDGQVTGMGFLAPMLNTAQRADLATYIANMPDPAPILSHSPFPGPIFPPTAVGVTATETVTVTNIGTAPLIFATNGAATIATGAFSADFSVSTSQGASFCQGMTLQPNSGSCTVMVQFSPQPGSATARNASLALLTTTSTTLVSMLGDLPSATPPVTPAPINSANAPSGGGGALPWQAMGLLLLALIPRLRRRELL